jgi:predicted permease
MRLLSELRWAWRGVRRRRWRAVLMIALIGLALGANSLLFSTTDSLVFRRLPYANPDRLVEFAAVAPGQSGVTRWYVGPALFEHLKSRSELFADVQGFITGGYSFLPGAGGPEMLRHTFVTPGLIEMLGWKPGWGRSLTDQDAVETSVRMALIAEELARQRFGSASDAVGRQLQTSDEPLIVAGVMPRGFRFPDNLQRLWRPLDYRRIAEGGRTSFDALGRLADGVGSDHASAALGALSAELRNETFTPGGWTVRAMPLRGSTANDTERRILFVLLGAALCLLAIACANVATLEIAAALPRARTVTIQSALGASRASLMRVPAIEGALLVGAALVVGGLVAASSLKAFNTWLPESLTRWSANPVDLDLRALLYMAAVAVAIWLLSSLPVALFSCRSDLVTLLKTEGRSQTLSRSGSRARKALTASQVALAVLLLTAGVLYVRSYLALLASDKGFDSEGLATVALTFPPEAVGFRASVEAVLARLRTRPDVKSVSTTAATDVQNTTMANLEVEGKTPEPHQTRMSMRAVDAEFFETMRIRLRRGATFASGAPADHVVIGDALARRLWPDQAEPIGRRFRTARADRWLTVIGVVDETRNESESPDGVRLGHFIVYTPQMPLPPRASSSAKPRAPATATRANVPKPGTLFYSQRLLVRVDPADRLDDIARDIRALDDRFRVTVEWVDDTYARAFADRLLAARIVIVFGGLAFCVAIAGLYGVMAFLVTSRTREIGIRMALGADRRDIGRLVLASSARLVIIGAVLGLGGALLLSRWVSSQFYGVSATDPLTYMLVGATMLATALVATWHPARQAASVDPAITLRAE